MQQIQRCRLFYSTHSSSFLQNMGPTLHKMQHSHLVPELIYQIKCSFFLGQKRPKWPLSHLQQYSPGLANRIWHVKLVELPFNDREMKKKKKNISLSIFFSIFLSFLANMCNTMNDLMEYGQPNHHTECTCKSPVWWNLKCDMWKRIFATSWFLKMLCCDSSVLMVWLDIGKISHGLEKILPASTGQTTGNYIKLTHLYIHVVCRNVKWQCFGLTSLNMAHDGKQAPSFTLLTRFSAQIKLKFCVWYLTLALDRVPCFYSSGSSLNSDISNYMPPWS